MAYCIKDALKRAEALEKKLEAAYDKPLSPLQCTMYPTKEPVAFSERLSGEKRTLAVGERWGELWDCAWMQFTGELPEGDRENIVLLIDLNGEGLVVDPQGNPVIGLTTGTSAYEYGSCRKHAVPLSLCQVQDGTVSIWLDAGCNDLFGRFVGSGTLKEACIAKRSEELRALYYDVHVLRDAMEALSADSPRYHTILRALNAASNEMLLYTETEAARARALLQPELQKKGGDPSLKISAVGHAHIDLAWLWPLRETVRKGARTFSHTLRLMERYPDYKFGASQPQLLAWMKQFYPALYDEIKAEVHSGRFEPQGAMWVEPDTNVTGGESLVRQLLFGARFWKEEFQFDVDNVWLPDVFGYSAALPQLMRKSGLRYFMTQKLSWNEHNSFPHHTFRWRGIDGSEVLTHMLPEETYNGPALPHSISYMEKNFKEKGLSDEALMLFGIGDGGGGPGAYHAERLSRMKNLAGFSPVEQRFARDFFHSIDRQETKYPVWQGELYLENHRGTYTSQARNKRYNRKLEYALRELEFVSVLADRYAEIPYPKPELEAIWKEVLLYQFHDILPGSSIKRVYDESLERYRVLSDQVSALIKERYEAITSGECVWNSLSFARTEILENDGVPVRIQVPAMGYAPLSAGVPVTMEGLCAQPLRLENEILRVQFNENGSIDSIWDKKACREVLEQGKAANVLMVYDDSDGDAWNIRMYYEDKQKSAFLLENSRCYLENAEAVMEQHYRFGESTLIQKIRLAAGSPLLEFDTTADWREDQKMLRTSMSFDIFASEAVCDIQFGSIKRPTHRNTSWDESRFEVCAHKWVDLSDGGYGLALINDCKYGYRIFENTLDLNLLRSSNNPGEQADRGEHSFRYALYPHMGDEKTAMVEQTALAFNVPLTVVSGKGGSIPETFPTSDCAHVEVSAVKMAEDSHATVIRLFETFGRKADCNLTIPEGYTHLSLCGLMEDDWEQLPIEDGKVALSFGPFEIHTVKMW